MISRLSIAITETLYKANVIEETDRELYIYGFFVLLSHCTFFLISGLFGILLGTTFESVIFYTMFSSLRCYAGGVHASKEMVCTCCTTVALFLASVCISFFQREGCALIPMCMLALCSVVVYLLCPLDSEDKPLSLNELNIYRRKSRMIVFGIIVISIIALPFRLYGLLYAASTCMTLECILLIAEKIRRLAKNHDNP